MDNTKLETGNAIQREIRELKDHLEDIIEGNKRRKQDTTCLRNEPELLVQIPYGNPNYSASYGNLKNRFFPISTSDFLSIYETKVKNRIEELQKQFDSL